MTIYLKQQAAQK